MECFEVIRANEMTADRARQLVQLCFQDMIKAVEADGGFIPETDAPDFEIEEQRALSREHIAVLQEQIDRNVFDGTVRMRLSAINFTRSSASLSAINETPMQLTSQNYALEAETCRHSPSSRRSWLQTSTCVFSTGAVSVCPRTSSGGLPDRTAVFGLRRGLAL
jgi:hypothetical protein